MLVKKYLPVLTLFAAAGIVAIPSLVGAQGFFGDVIDRVVPYGPFGGSTLLDVVGTIITLAFGVSAIVAVIYLIIGGFSYVTSSGDPEAVQLAKTTIVNAIIGLVVILASYLIIQFILGQIGANPELPENTF